MNYLTEQDYARLQAEGQPLVQAVHYDEADNRIVLSLADGVRVSIPVAVVDEFRQVPASALKRLRLAVSGEALELDEHDIHISTRGLLRDVLAC